MVDGAALEKRCAKAPWVRIPPSPPDPPADGVAALRLGPRRASGDPTLRVPVPYAVERSPSGLGRRTGNAVWGNPSRVRIPPSPPILGPIASWSSASSLGERFAIHDSERLSTVSFSGRARRGTSGALNLQSAPAGLNSHPRSPSSKAALASDVEGRVPRSVDSRTGSDPEGSSPKRCPTGAAVRPGPSRSERWARGRRIDGGCTALPRSPDPST